jgi:hypothetical protein
MNRTEILEKAGEYINGQRAQDYGDAHDNFDRIAEGWNIILRSALTTHGYLSAQHVALMLDWMKTSRLLNSLDHSDSWVDKCGYSALGGEFITNEAERQSRLNEVLNKSKT